MYRSRGLQARLVKMDNEVSRAMHKYIKGAKLESEFPLATQIVAPNDHRRNQAERAIRTFKGHFITILATTDPSFPVKDWDLLLDHTLLTLNLLRQSRINNKLSAYAQVQGLYDFNKNPIAPAGCRVMILNHPNERGSW